MDASATGSALPNKEIPEELRPVLISLGKGLGTAAVYGPSHPSVELLIDQLFNDLRNALQNRRTLALGTFNGTLTVDEGPVVARDVPVRTLERRLASMKVSHLALTRGLTRDELKKLLLALCAPSDTQMKDSLASAGLSHVEMSDVKYVALRGGEQKSTGGSGGEKTDGGSGAGEKSPSANISQIVAFFKGDPAGSAGAAEVKKMLSDPERLGQMILEASALRQSSVSAQDGESMADILIGCLRRTFDGLRKESEFQSVPGKVNLSKAMMLLEKSVLDKIHASLGAKHPEIDRRIFSALREMEEDQQFSVLSAHYTEQRRKLEKAEEKLIEKIRQQGAEKVRTQPGAEEISARDWQRLVVKAGGSGEGPGGPGGGSGTPDLSALAVVLERLDSLMQAGGSPEQVQNAVNVTRTGMNAYADRIENRIQELEGQIQLHPASATPTVEDHAEHLDREALMLEVSQLTLALLQPLTVVNASVESALRRAEEPLQKELLGLAFESGKRMQELTRRLMTLVGYPVLPK
jgi:hypothetical protein